MSRFKKVLRIAGLVILILLAASGLGFGFFFTNTRHRYHDKETRIELVDKKYNNEQTKMEEVKNS
ncbi:MAG: hypothetical protein KF803_04575 [Cyclobacteriaceae bacterium]|nr:hypothetical protein [Cyclobacteriaceae bacterium]